MTQLKPFSSRQLVYRLALEAFTLECLALVNILRLKTAQDLTKSRGNTPSATSWSHKSTHTFTG
jgi:hypothetical protein